MNFLLHHRLALRDLGSPAAAAGAMLPDLWRMADRRVRPVQGTPAGGWNGDDDQLAGVLAGIEHHLLVDRWFHAAPVFLEGERLFGERLRAADLRTGRLVLFAHVLWELCLDGELVKRTGLSALLTSLRASLAAAFDAPARRAAERHHFDRVARTPADRALFEGRVARLSIELARGPWIDGYQTGQGIAERLEGVRARLGLPALAKAEHQRLAGVVDTMLEEAPAALDEVLRASVTPLRRGASTS